MLGLIPMSSRYNYNFTELARIEFCGAISFNIFVFFHFSFPLFDFYSCTSFFSFLYRVCQFWTVGKV